MEETEDKHAEKDREYSIHQARLCTLPYARILFTCHGPASICLMLTTPPPCFSKSPGDPWPPATASPFNTHFTPPVPHMNNTSSDSLHGVNESIASRASEALMAAPSRPLACAPFATRCPRCRVMNYGSPSLALFCHVTTLEGDCMWFSAARLIFMPIHLKARLLWCNVAPTAAAEHADELTCVNTLTKADLTGTFMHTCVNKYPAEYWMMVKAVGLCSFPSVLEPNTIGATLTVGVKSGSQPDPLVFTLWEEKRGSDWRATPYCAVTTHHSPASMTPRVFCYWHNVFSPQLSIIKH